MTKSAAQHIVAAWVVAIVVTGALIVFLLKSGQQHRQAQLEGVATVMIGTSLARYASPDPNGNAELQSIQSSPFLRLSYPLATDLMLLQLADAASKAGVSMVLVEINPIVSRFPIQPSGCGPVAFVSSWLGEIRASARMLLKNSDPSVNGTENLSEYPEYHVIEDQLSLFYPLTIAGSCREDRWQRLITANPNTDFVFIAMPRAPVARDLIGSDVMADFYEEAERFNNVVGGSLFVVDPESRWGKENFVSQAYLGKAGAKRFAELLGAWWRAMP